MVDAKSSKPKKQRLFHYKKALHLKQAGLAGHLDSKLRKELGTRSVALRKNDSVKVMRGGKKGKTGKIIRVDYKKGVVFVEKLVRKKANGEEIPLPVPASSLLVVDVDRNDARRFKGKKALKQEAGKKEKQEGGKAEGKENEKAAEKKETAKAKDRIKKDKGKAGEGTGVSGKEKKVR